MYGRNGCEAVLTRIYDIWREWMFLPEIAWNKGRYICVYHWFLVSLHTDTNIFAVLYCWCLNCCCSYICCRWWQLPCYFSGWRFGSSGRHSGSSLGWPVSCCFFLAGWWHLCLHLSSEENRSHDVAAGNNIEQKSHTCFFQQMRLSSVRGSS